MEWFSGVLGTVMNICYGLLSNYGLAIILFTLITKIILFPLSVWVQKNSIKMVKMQPELNRIHTKYFGDKDRISEEQSKLYKKEGYNPLATLVPLIIQITLLMGVVTVIYRPMSYILKIPNTVTEPFKEVVLQNHPELDPESNSLQLAVIDDIQNGTPEIVSAYTAVAGDPAEIQAAVNKGRNFHMSFCGVNLSWIASLRWGMALLAPLMAAFSAWLLSVAENAANVLQKEQGWWGRNGTMIFSVALSLYLGFYVPAGVALYWVASNLLAIVQQYLLNWMIDPKKFVDYEALEETRQALAELEGPKKKFKLNDPLRRRVREDYKRFFSVANKHLVFYSESNGFYKYYAGMIEYILKYTNIPIHYITSDPDDHIFKMAEENDQIKPYYIDMQTLITLMMKMDADVVAMTMPDLETYQIKRSYVRKDIEYINLCHGIGSYNLTFRKGAVDHFDTVFLAGKHQVEEIRKQEAVYGLPAKELVECGYPLLDDMRRDYAASSHEEHAQKTVLIAPSWHTGNIMESCLEEILEALKDEDYHIIVRPHPQHVRHNGPQLEALKKRYENNKNIEIQTDFTSSSTVFEADIIVSDWSSVAYEFVFTTCKPAIFVNTPMKVMNPEYQKIDTVPFDIWTRNVVGDTVELDNVSAIREKIAYLLNNSEKYRETIEKTTEEYVYNLGTSAEVGARYLISAVQKQIEKRHQNEGQNDSVN